MSVMFNPSWVSTVGLSRFNEKFPLASAWIGSSSTFNAGVITRITTLELGSVVPLNPNRGLSGLRLTSTPKLPMVTGCSMLVPTPMLATLLGLPAGSRPTTPTCAFSNWSQPKSMSRSVSRLSDASPLLSAVTVAVAVTPPTSTVTVSSVPGSAEMVSRLPTSDSTGVAGGTVSMVNATGVEAVPPLMSAVIVDAPSGNGPCPPGGVSVTVTVPAAISPAVRIWLTSAS
ncbi:hypothetical protein D3C72_1428870 [compost metagenome]